MVTRSVPQKRKQTNDAMESPPKRVTRARAAKPTPNTDVVATKVKTASASTKSAAAKKKAESATTKSTSRSTRKKAPTTSEVPEPETQEAEECEQVDSPVVESVKSAATRTKKAAATSKAPKTKEETAKPKARATRSVAPKAEPAATKTRTRGRKTAENVPEDHAKAADVETDAPAPDVSTTKPATRSKPAASTRATRTKAAPTIRATTTRKKVQFEDELDKENIPIEVDEPKKSAPKATGLRAKPVRKAATTKKTTAGKKGTRGSASTVETDKKVAKPLSPKKIEQVARMSSLSDDELGTAELSPLKTLSKSPIKAQLSPVRPAQSPIRSNMSFVSPSKSTTGSILASPARRAAPSPFKDSMRSPAKKVDLGASISRSLFTASRNTSPAKASLLQESPRKVKIADQTLPSLDHSTSPFKKSLLQSPARRPQVSPFKGMPSASRATPALSKHVEQKPPTEVEAPTNILQADTLNVEDTQVDDVDIAENTMFEPDPMDVDSVVQERDTTMFEAANESMTSNPSVNLIGTNEQSVVHPLQPSGDHFGAQAAGSEFTFQGPQAAFSSMDYRRISNMSQLSEDELASPDKRFAPTPRRKQALSTDDEETPAGQAQTASFTPLADKLNVWSASSPDKKKPSRLQRGIFSLAANDPQPEALDLEVEQPVDSPVKTSLFEDDIAVLDMQQPTPERPSDVLEAPTETDLGASMESLASQEYGDENAVPSEAERLRIEQENNDPTLTCTPAKVFTPARQVTGRSHEAYTVSKVPLRPSAEDSPLKLPRQRSKSLGGALSVLVDQESNDQDASERPTTPVIAATALTQTPCSGMKLDAETPGRTGRKRGSSNVLKGAFVFVDVHTSEGADASSIFVDLLTQMGAKCVKQWNWNPRASVGDALDTEQSPAASSPSGSSNASKVGITHVVYKDGGVRTLEKVRMSNGVVACVGVGWVLDCEREDKWLDESGYAIDTSIVPRGGQRRRKSMEPRALANLGGNLVPASQETPAKAGISPTKEFLTLNTPQSRRDTFTLNVQQVTPEEADRFSNDPPATPEVDQGEDVPVDFTANGGMSPTTPYFLSKGAELVQQTCPPKQRGEGLFPVSGNVEDEPDDAVRRRLLAARRRTLQFSSKTQSPLGRTVSYGNQRL